jgi:hypothetical protein
MQLDDSKPYKDAPTVREGNPLPLPVPGHDGTPYILSEALEGDFMETLILFCLDVEDITGWIWTGLMVRPWTTLEVQSSRAAGDPREIPLLVGNMLPQR